MGSALSSVLAGASRPLETMEYGMREFEVEDPDRHRLVFGMGV